MSGATHEAANDYATLIAEWSGWRVALCRDGLQWLIQKRAKKACQRPWASRQYCATQKALLRLCAASHAPCEAMEILRILPDHAGRFDLERWRATKADLVL